MRIKMKEIQETQEPREADIQTAVNTVVAMAKLVYDAAIRFGFSSQQAFQLASVHYMKMMEK